MRLAVLPIDSRPCNTQFVHELVRWAGAECVLPPAQAMDDFHRPAPYAMTRQFLETELSLCDAAVISLDHWCFGGLLASRDDQVTTEEALSRVADLTALLRAHPDVPVYMSSIIMRSSKTGKRQKMPGSASPRTCWIKCFACAGGICR